MSGQEQQDVFAAVAGQLGRTPPPEHSQTSAPYAQDTFVPMESQTALRPTSQVSEAGLAAARILLGGSSPRKPAPLPRTLPQGPAPIRTPRPPQQPVKTPPRGIHRLRHAVWSGGKGRKAATSFIIGGALSAVSLQAADMTPRDAAEAAITYVTGSNQQNITYSPDCTTPLAEAVVDSTGKLVLALNVYTSLEEKQKAAADKNYKPATYKGFFDTGTDIDAQKRDLPTTRFGSGGATESRLPEGKYSGTLQIGVCKGDDVPATAPSAIRQTGQNSVEVNASLLKVNVIGYKAGFEKRYEKYEYKPLADPAAEAASTLVAGEIERLNKVIMPGYQTDAQKSDPKQSNEPLLNRLELASLQSFSDSCGGDLYEVIKAQIIAQISKQNKRDVTVSFTGGFEGLADSFAKPLPKAALGGTEDSKFIDITVAEQCTVVPVGGTQS